VSDGFRGEAAAQHAPCEPLHVLTCDRVDRPMTERRRDVDALHRLQVRAIRRPDALDVEPGAERLDGLIDRRRALTGCGDRLDSGGLDELAQAPLRLGASDPALLAADPDLAELAIDALAADSDPSAVVGAPLDVHRPAAQPERSRRTRCDSAL
jgi:hypothetical protein